MSLQRSGGYQIRRESGRDRAPGGLPVTYGSEMMAVRSESEAWSIVAANATGANTVMVPEASAGARATR